jgi:hypothetical protein
MVYIGFMKTLLFTAANPEIEGKAFRKRIKTLADWQINTVASGALTKAVTGSNVTVVRLNCDTSPAQLKAIIPRLAQRQANAPQGSYIIFALKRQVHPAPKKAQQSKRSALAVMDEIRHGLLEFPHPERVDISIGEDEVELMEKLLLIEAKMKIAPSRPSPLDHVKEVLQATQDLRVANGKLSAEAVADAFGLKLSQLARWLGRTRQALNKTPDADSLQDELAFFERVARLRAVLPKGEFLKWLRMPNAELEDKKPLEVLASGQRQIMADLVDDMLTGAPA